ncbi:MAG TPA: HNH endonuclease signature motif containing protein [Williamwhitmania sp.]|nr:HNH endonuclease signature motif containing protein [Williamwhitmania sp.]
MANKKPNKWTDLEIEFLKENLNKMSCLQIGDSIGKSKHQVSNCMYKMKLKRTPEARKKLIRLNQFKKGHTPWTKGMKGVHFSRSTEYKKGHVPASLKYDGCVVIRKGPHGTYKWIRISNNKWMLYHQYIWLKNNRTIPASSVIYFINGVSTDCRIENLGCITKKENMNRNRNYEKARITNKKTWASGKVYDNDQYISSCISRTDKELRKELIKYPELLELKRIQLKLRRAINESK